MVARPSTIWERRTKLLMHEVGKEVETFKAKNASTEMLCGLDQRIEERDGGGLQFLDRHLIPKVGDVRNLIIEEAHATKYYVRPRVSKMLYDLRYTNWWPSIRKDIAGGVNEAVARHGVHLSSILDRDGMYIEVLEKDVKVVRNTSRYEACKRNLVVVGILTFREAEIGESKMIGLELEQETTTIIVIKERLKEAKDRVVYFGKKGELAPRYIGPFEILKKIGPVAYRLRLPDEDWCSMFSVQRFDLLFVKSKDALDLCSLIIFMGLHEVKGGTRVAFKDEFRAAEEREVLCEAQQGQNGVKRKLFGSFRNKIEALGVRDEECDLDGSRASTRHFQSDGLNMRQRRWMKLFSDYGCEIKYHMGKENIVIDPWIRKGGVKPRRVRDICRTIQAKISEKMLVAIMEFDYGGGACDEAEIGESKMIGLEMEQETTKVVVIKERLKEASLPSSELKA
uniref:Reverse transcriptase domain-containing protein n=1 Tax=Tanacetum cinerariifolium TaxID=118510 RepID=A0A699HBX8_TANCI|nr:reverse transcriptase domain-containing protein [Tanacetum cinerariifolium]